MKNNDPIITYDHMEEEKNQAENPAKTQNNIVDILMLMAEEALVVILFISMMFLF